MRPHFPTSQQCRILLGDAGGLLLELRLYLRYGVLEVLFQVSSGLGVWVVGLSGVGGGGIGGAGGAALFVGASHTLRLSRHTIRPGPYTRQFMLLTLQLRFYQPGAHHHDTHPFQQQHASTYTISLLRCHATRVTLQLLADLLRRLLVVALTSQLGLHLGGLRTLRCAAFGLGDAGDVLRGFGGGVGSESAGGGGEGAWGEGVGDES